VPKLVRFTKVDNERVIRRAAFEREDLCKGFRVGGIGSEAVYRLRGQGNHSASTQHGSGFSEG
jgi:hypothetical protein